MTLPTTAPRAADVPPAPVAGALRLRPVVHATPLAAGVHVRGWTSSFTVDGGPGLWRLWRALAAALATGADPERLAALRARAGTGDAVETLLAQLHEHDMLVRVPAGWPADGDTGPAGAGAPPAGVARWLEAVAPCPVTAWDRIRAVRVEVTGQGRLAAAAARALTAAGARVDRGTGGGRGRVVLAAGPVAVAAGADGDAGFAGAATGASRVGADTAAAVAEHDAVALAVRLGLAELDGPDAETPVLAALVGGAAAHRLVCAVAGLPDPGADPAGPGPVSAAGVPGVFVARLDPLRGRYHPWTGPDAGAGGPEPGGAGTDRLDRALALADVLTDPELGPLPPVRIADLPQVPAGLVTATSSAGTAAGVGVTVDVARVLAVVGAVELATGGAGTGSVLRAVGADRRHADGTVLRRLVHLLAPAGPAAGDASWAGSPVARQWWKALTLRFGVRARVEVLRVAEGVHVASVRGDPDGRELGWAVEADPADAVAFALLAAVGDAQHRAADGTAGAVLVAPNGATPAPPQADRTRVPWHGGAWAWPAPVGDVEEALQERLRGLTGADPHPVPAGRLAGAAVAVPR
jgi:hypothetical protein